MYFYSIERDSTPTGCFEWTVRRYDENNPADAGTHVASFATHDDALGYVAHETVNNLLSD